MALSRSVLSELLDAFRAGEGVDLVRDAVRLVMQELIKSRLGGEGTLKEINVNGRAGRFAGSPRFRVGSWVAGSSRACRRRAGSGRGDVGISPVRTRRA